MMPRGVAGLAVFILLAWAMSENRRRVSVKLIAAGIGSQLLLGLVLLKLPACMQFFLLLNEAVMALVAATTAGTAFVFGYLGGGELPFAEAYPGASFILAFRALPLVLVVSALSALLFHWRILPLVVAGLFLVPEKNHGRGRGPKVWRCRPMYSWAWWSRPFSSGPTWRR